MNLKESIKFGKNKPNNIFSDIAEESAKKIKNDGGKEKNKTTQIRKFYDELLMWYDRVQQSSNKEEKYKELEAFIKMLKAKVAYAKGRGHVDNTFVAIFNQTIDEIHDAETLRDARLFFEAVIGYCKCYE